jgi:hypothetical protein
MKQHLDLPAPLNRRHWMTLALASLAGCGGGADSLLAGLPGTGGTGIFTTGAITGFGSVRINGIKFDDLQAAVQMDGLVATSNDLRVGMVAAVQGLRAADLTLGTASSIEVWSIARAPVTRVTATDFTLAGMTVQTDVDTSFYGVAGLSGLQPDQWVTVWGLQSGADASVWTATCVALQSGMGMGMVSATGLVKLSDGQRRLNGMQLSGSEVGKLPEGSLVRVEGAMNSEGSRMTVANFKLMDSGLAGSTQGEIEMEGMVTALLSPSRFMLGNVEVDASSALYKPLGSQLMLGARVEVYGSWQAGVLKATDVEFEDPQLVKQVEIEARIEQFISLANFVLRGQLCDASSASISGGTVSEIKANVKVKVSGVKAGEVLLVSALQLSH